MKKLLLLTALFTSMFVLAACDSAATEEGGYELAYSFTYEEIALFDLMITPGGAVDQGVVMGVDHEGGFVTIKAGPNGWGGVQTPALNLDMSREPIFLVRVNESPDAFKWGVQTLLSDLVGESWGLYIINDNDMKWNQYAGGNIADSIGVTYSDYGTILDLHFWIYPAGSPDAFVQITEIVIFYTK